MSWYYPLTITAVGIIASFFTTYFASNFMSVNEKNVEWIPKVQLIVSTLLLTGAI
jgi:flagellar biosynthesis protein FliQ